MSSWDWLIKLAPAVIGAGATMYGASQQSKAQEQAAQGAATAQQQATAAEQESLRIARENMLRQQSAASPGLVGVQQIIGRGEALTPLQEQSLEDARRSTLNTLQGGSLRGSARATAATVADVEGRMKNQFIEMNRNRADQAASNLSGQYFNAGNNVSNLDLKTGASASQGLLGVGNTDYANTLNQGVIKGQAIGDIGAVIADSLKTSQQEKRDSSYEPVKYEDINWHTPRTGAI